MDFLSQIQEIFSLNEENPAEYSPLVLAYIGDGVYDLIVRSLLISQGNMPVDKLNRKASLMCRASAQAALLQAIAELLTEEESAIARRGRNAKSYTKAKNATMSEYRHATGMEALCGYLYLKKQYERLFCLVQEGMKRTDLL